MKQIIIIFLLSILFIGCMKDAQEITQVGEYKVEFVLEHEGVKVYRFNDRNRYIYYTNTKGLTEWTETHSNGKSSHTEHIQVNNN